ncbi:helix-turn-helix domain-containing protein [Bordetella bronchiseptica]
MSHQAVSWALKQPVNHSPAKFVLVVLAHHVSASKRPWTAFASITLLAQQTGQDRKTVIANLKRLVDLGFLVDTGERTGTTKSVVVYCLAEPQSSTEIGTPKQSQNRDTLAVPNLGHLSSTGTGTASDDFSPSSPKTGTASAGSSPKIGTPGKPEAVPVFPTEQNKEEVIPLFVGTTSEKSNSVVEKLPKPASTRGSRLPDTWVLPRSWGLAAQRLCPGLTAERIREIAEEFRDYWVALPGAKACKLDWLATWRNWVRKEARRLAIGRSFRRGDVAVDQFGIQL